MLSRRDREEIEKTGVPYVIAAILDSWQNDITIENITMVTNRWEQYKGKDYIVTDEYRNEIYIDSKYHRGKSYKQSYTDYGVNILSIEVTKANGRKGWGINTELKTDYIIEMIQGVGYYMINAHKLHEFMLDKYADYPTIYSNKGCEDYRGVPVEDLMEYEVIIYFQPWEEIADKGLSFINGSNEYYNDNIEPLLKDLITGRK